MGVWLTEEEKKAFMRMCFVDLAPGEFWQSIKKYCPEVAEWAEREERRLARAAAKAEAKASVPAKPKRVARAADGVQSTRPTRRSTKR